MLSLSFLCISLPFMGLWYKFERENEQQTFPEQTHRCSECNKSLNNTKHFKESWNTHEQINSIVQTDHQETQACCLEPVIPDVILRCLNESHHAQIHKNIRFKSKMFYRYIIFTSWHVEGLPNTGMEKASSTYLFTYLCLLTPGDVGSPLNHQLSFLRSNTGWVHYTTEDRRVEMGHFMLNNLYDH